MMNSSKLMVLLRRRRSGEYIHADLDLYTVITIENLPGRFCLYCKGRFLR